MHDDFDFEPVRGLPEMLPEGEKLLWQGEPGWQVLARRLFRVRVLAMYFLVVTAAVVGASIAEGGFGAVSWVAVLAAPTLGIGLLVLMAWLIARSTVYTITSKRVVMRFGVALPMTVNVAYACVESAAVKRYGDGSGDISLALAPGSRVGYGVMWPHVRPWRFARAEPTLRGLPNVELAATKIATALATPRVVAVPAAANDATSQPDGLAVGSV